jgi:predicted nucleic acid-binding protein
VLWFVDTSVLLYSISRAPSENRKRGQAIELLDRDNLAVSTQVLQEFYWQATRSTCPHPIPHRAAAALITAWSRFPVQDMSLDIVKAGLEICRRHGLPYWDAAIVAAAQALGCDQLLSEDMQDGRRINSLTIVNPFR